MKYSRWMKHFCEERIIRKSGLFDAEYYLRENPDVAASHIDPLRHFVLMGASEGRNPSEAFDVSNYMKQNADLAATGINPLVHYIKSCKSGGRLHNTFKTEEQRMERLIREAGLFDDAFYLKNNPNIAETNLTPYEHFMQYGAWEGRNPSPNFDVCYYLENNPDVAASGINPLEHYIIYGKDEGREPKEADELRLEKMIREAGLFDDDYYLENNPDVADANLPPYEHFMQYGAWEGRNPSPDFDVCYYLENNPDVAEGGMNPLEHYIRCGKDEGRLPKAPETYEERLERLIRKEKLFDEAYYLERNPDVAAANLSAYEHFMHNGVWEGRNPSRKFDVRYYLENNPDVAAKKINPLEHYVLNGKEEGRLPKMPMRSLPGSSGALYDGSTLIFDHNAGGGTGKYVYNHLLRSPDMASGALLAYYKPATETYHIDVRSGVQIKEKTRYEKWSRVKADLNKIRFSRIIVNNLVLWPSARDVLQWVESYNKSHPDVIVEYKLHDFYCVCPSYTLLDSSEKFCGIRCDETGCADCVEQSQMNHTFLDQDNRETFSVTRWRAMWSSFFTGTADVIEVFSPSSKEIFTKAYPEAADKLRLKPHQISSFACCNVAVIGSLTMHKGAGVIKAFCKFLNDNCIDDMHVYLFGNNAENISSPHLTEMGAYQRNELPQKLKDAGIDVVLIPSICPETFCYTAGESLALGYPTACFNLGGQADQVRASDKGMILHSEEPDYMYSMLKKLAGMDDAQPQEKPEAGEHTRTVVVQDTAGRDFLKWMYAQRADKSHFVKEAEDSIQMRDGMPMVIAEYLPQFHEFPENTRWFGKGFTEWTNTSQTLPQFLGHRQPHVPVDVGYYNLDHTDAMRRQAELAKKYGISGFCVYYYWFSGKKLMHKPMEKLLADKTLDFPFFFFWADEDWTMLWGNGAYRETLYKGEVRAKDADRFMADILPYMKDSRYIKIGNKPMLLIYKLKKCEKSEYDGFVRRIREIAVENGFDGLYLIAPIDEFMDLDRLEDTQKEYELDALMEFSAIAGRRGWNFMHEEFFDPACRSICYDVEDFVANRKYILNTRAKVFPGLITNWDNSPRRYDRGASILQNSPENYKKWLADLIRWTREHNAPDERFIFVNAWNEWAECAHLEPDTYYGYAYLQKTREALEESVEN